MSKKETAPKAPQKAPKQKPPKEPKAKKVKTGKAEKGPSEKKKIPKILFIILPLILVLAVAAAAVYIIFFRTPPSPQEEVEKIAKKTDIYQVGADEIVSLESILEEGEIKRNSVEMPFVDDETGEMERIEFTYHYRDIQGHPSRLAEDYVEVLRGEEQGFTLVDQEHHQLEEEPDMRTDFGSVFLAKASVENAEPEEDGGGEASGEEDAGKEEQGESGGSGEAAGDKLVEVAVVWSDTAIAVRVSQQDGKILPPVREEDTAEVQREPLALMAQLEYFNNLAPEKLGLSGDYMSEYRVYPQDGLVRVSGVTCRVLNVYLMDLPAETNTFMGTYYLSTDNTQIFKLADDGTIVSLDMS